MMKKLSLSLLALAIGSMANAQCDELFFSEYIEGSHNNKAVEIYNPTSSAISLSAYQVVRYSNGSQTPNGVQLSGTIQPKSTYVVALDKRDAESTGQDTMLFQPLLFLADTFACPVYEQNRAMYFNGNDAVTLEKNGIPVDIIGEVGVDPNDKGWNDDAETNYMATDQTWWNNWTADQTLIRKPNIEAGVTANPSPFMVHVEWDSIPRNAFMELGKHNCTCDEATYNANYTYDMTVSYSGEAWTTVREVAPAHSAFFFPNPVTDGQFTVKASAIVRSVSISNILGQNVHNQNNTQRRGDLQVFIPELGQGLYLVNILFEDNTRLTQKIVVR